MILLDTHVLLWWLADDARLGPEARAEIIDPAMNVAVSVVSVFEIETKRRIGKLVAPTGLLAAVAADRFALLDLEARQAELAGAMTWSHCDPFDRLLVAQSRLTGAVLLTADRRILAEEPSARSARSPTP